MLRNLGGLNLSSIEDLLAETESENDYPIPEQFGPMRQYDNEMRCASRGCGSSTFHKLQGVPYCMIHIMRKMNEMLYELGVMQ